MSPSPAVLAPACASDSGSWCAKLWNSTGVSWLAENADGLTTRAWHILLIGLLALLVHSLVRRSINRLTRITAKGSVPKMLQPIANRAEGVLINPAAVARRAQRAKSLGSLLRSISSFVIFSIAGVLILSELGIDITPILASAGIAGVAVGFGAQSLVRDFLSGIFMTVEDQLGVGDSVDLGPASGVVTEVSLRTTTVRAADGTLWHVRNGEIVRVGNSSQDAAVVVVEFTVPYHVDAARAGRLALAAAAEVAASDDFAPAVVAAPTLQGITGMTADLVTLAVSTTMRPGSQAAYARAVRGAVKVAFDRAGFGTAGVGTPAPSQAADTGQ